MSKKAVTEPSETPVATEDPRRRKLMEQARRLRRDLLNGSLNLQEEALAMEHANKILMVISGVQFPATEPEEKSGDESPFL